MHTGGKRRDGDLRDKPRRHNRTKEWLPLPFSTFTNSQSTQVHHIIREYPEELDDSFTYILTGKDSPSSKGKELDVKEDLSERCICEKDDDDVEMEEEEIDLPDDDDLPVEQKLMIRLMKSYERAVRPVKNASDTVVVRMGMTITQIFDMVSSSSLSYFR